MTNHLLIGLGGTGGKILRSLRKQIYQNLRAVDPQGVNLRYLYVDSDEALMETGAPSWKTLGRSVQLPQNSRLPIKGMGLDAVLSDLQRYPGISPWIGDRDTWTDILQAAKGAQIAGGQKRRLGRFLFANRVADFGDAVGTLVNDMTRGGQTEVAFHVCCGLAGGTGSGTVVDVVAQLRAKYGTGADDHPVLVFVYALLPERHPNATWAGPNYHANGYAALRELNALAVGAWRPHDLTGRKLAPGRFQREAERLDIQDPFNVCYLFTDENAAGYRVDVDRTLPDVVASFLYHKVVTAADVGREGLGMLHRQETFQIGKQAAGSEREVPDGPETRTLRFYTFGIKTLAYPEEEILEYLTFSFAEQAALQLRYNHWADGVGYTDEPRRQSFDGYIRNKETQTRWRITDAHLTLSEGILDDERESGRWKPHDADWSSAKAHSVDFVLENVDKKAWLDRLGQLFERRFSEDFRRQGVPTFYSQRDRLRADYVAHIRGTIERELFERWVTADLSMHEIGLMLAALGRELDERLRALQGALVKENEAAETHGELAQATDLAAAHLRVPYVPGTYKRLLAEKAVTLEKRYHARTRATALDFAQRLLVGLRESVSQLRGEVDQATSTLAQAAERFRAETKARLTDAGEGDTGGQTIRFYDPAAVRALSSRLVRDEEVQRTQTARMRERLTELIGEGADPTFTRFNGSADLQALVDAFADQASQNAQAAHDAVRESGDPALLGVSILDKLHERFGASDDALRGYLEELVKQAQTFATLSGGELAKDVPGRTKAFSTFTFILPDTKERPEFGARLERALREAVPAGAADDVDVVTSPVRKNELVILNVVSALPARVLAPVAYLEERYLERLQDGARAALETHLEGDGSGLPDLFQPVAPPHALPYLLLSYQIGVITSRPDAAGRDGLVFEVRDKRGLTTGSVPLGATLPEAADRLTLELGHALREATDAHLISDAYATPAARASVLDGVTQTVRALQSTLPNGQGEAFGAAVGDVEKILRLA
jgi:hypothetical protein